METFFNIFDYSYLFYVLGNHAPDDVKILPLDLASGEASLREAVEKAESFFPDSGVHYMIHNAAYERPVCTLINLIIHFQDEVPCMKKNGVMIIICL